MNRDRCANCGRPRGMALQRKSWKFDFNTPNTPRTSNPEHKPSQIHNDLICNAGVWRNGGTDADTHLCDNCLRIGLRAIKIAVDEALESLDLDHDKNVEIADLTERLGSLQLRYHWAVFDYRRAQERMKDLLNEPQNEMAIKYAKLEASRHVDEIY